jgi:hypothetical protein
MHAIRLVAATFVLALAAGQASAGMLVLNYAGLTAAPSRIDGTPIAPETPFDVHAIFITPPFKTAKGSGDYVVSSVTADVGGTPYAASRTRKILVRLFDPSGPFTGVNVPELINTSVRVGFAPGYHTATPPLDATAATPTVFSDYLGSLEGAFSMPTASGSLALRYDLRDGVSASITAVPEPSTLCISLVACLGLGAATRLRRRAA